MAASPIYLDLSPETLENKVQQALASLEDCRACPRNCGVNRLKDKWSACKTGRDAVVSSAFPHFGEEDCLRGWNGSGTIFFSHCNLRCVFCQNFEISQGVKPGWNTGLSGPELAGLMLRLQEKGCHNINFVTPEHVVPQIIESLALAIAGGLHIPLVYNTSAYDSLESLRLLDGLVDIYMPDFKYWSSEKSHRYLKANDYPAAARSAIREMHRQVGPLQLDDDGLAVRGVLIRHLVMPGGLEETQAILKWIAGQLGADSYINLMDQYRPQGKVDASHYEELNGPLQFSEFQQAQSIARDLGLNRLDQRQPNRRLLVELLPPH